MATHLMCIGLALALLCPTRGHAQPPTSADVLERAQPSDWRSLDPTRTLYLELTTGRVVIELAPEFAPQHVANIRALARQKFCDGLAIVRVQDNYVVQWGDPTEKRYLGAVPRSLPAEYTRTTDGMAWTPHLDADLYAPEVGWSLGLPAARDPKSKQVWLAHCYGMVGVGRDLPPDTGTGAELYAVSGHAPRHLDRNLAVVGRVVQGIELLTALPRGTEPMGFYRKDQPLPGILRAVLAADLPLAERTPLELLRTDTPTWQAWVQSRRVRREPFFVQSPGSVELCNVPLPSRVPPQPK
jgi:peptidylprolyl isomerase